jgi:cytidylate kinase
MDVLHFLHAMTHEPPSFAEADAPQGSRPFVTVSRQAGAGGHALADALVAATERARHKPLFQGWRVLDQEICRAVASNPRLRVSYETLLRKEYRSPWEELVYDLVPGVSSQSAVLREMFRVVRSAARAGRVVLVGRAASCLTRELPYGVHLRLVAPFGVRVRRIMGLLGLEERRAAALVTEQDEARRDLVASCFGRDIDDPLLYDAVWNTESVPIDTIAATTVRLIDHRFRVDVRATRPAAGETSREEVNRVREYWEMHP